MQKVLPLLCAAGLLAGAAHAQTRPGAKAPVRRAAPAHRAATAPKTTPAANAAARPAPPPVALAATAAAPAAPGRLSPASAARPLFGVGTSTLNVGVGFGLGYGYGSLGGNASSTPALSVSYLRGLTQAGPGVVSVGGLVGYKSYGWESAGAKATWRNLYVGARGAYHYNFGNPRLDTYAGLGLGLRVVSYSDNYDAQATASASGSQAELSGFLGARYFFSDKLGAFSELGYDMSYLKVGLSARF